MKVIALYLPQFHKVPENEAWWGKDFTDWVSAQNGTALFESHYQPHVPLNKNYYNLLEKSVMEWQADLMQKYQVDGLCFYHYWFKDGKRLLEKPAENLLKWDDINMPFCFCWANMSWARSWAKMKDADFWINEDEVQVTQDGKALLIEQTYGEEKEWKDHFEYLMPFFEDERYIKIDGKPVFWIHRTDLIDCLDGMMKYWNELAKENGLEGIYVIGSFYNEKHKEVLDAAVIYEPGEVMPDVSYEKHESGVCIYDYDEYWETGMKYDYSNIKTYYMGVVNYDDTARQGKNGHIIAGDPKKFGIWLQKLMKKSELKGNEVVFLNAWNEWGEGNHLEPDEKYGYGYLEEIVKAKELYRNINELELQEGKGEDFLTIRRYQNMTQKIQNNMNLLEVWLKLKQKRIELSEHPIFNEVSHIAVYGMGVLGKLLKSEFEGTRIQIDYYIDKNAEILKNEEENLYTLEDDISPVDIIIVSLLNYRNEICTLFKKYNITNYVFIDEVIRELEMTYIEQ